MLAQYYSNFVEKNLLTSKYMTSVSMSGFNQDSSYAITDKKSGFCSTRFVISFADNVQFIKRHAINIYSTVEIHLHHS
jgi:hypothetical protein